MGERLALVTGGTAGIGRGVALALAAEGWHVVAAARRPEAAGADLAQSVELRFCDVTDPASVGALVDTLREGQRPLGALVNCAGITLPRRPFAETDEADVERIFAVNVFGTLRMCRAALALMTAGGTIVNLSSTLAWRPRPGSALYAATKGAIDTFSRSLATEVAARAIRVHVVGPALVRSRIWLEAGTTPEDYEALLAARAGEFPLGRAGEPEDVAGLIAYLVSDRAAWLTGNAIQVDGGAMLR